MTTAERYRFYRQWHGRAIAITMAADSAVFWGTVTGVSVAMTLWAVLP